MKHTAKVTAILIIVFVISQIFGLYTLNKDLKVTKDDATGQVELSYSETAIGQRPDVNSYTAVLYILFAIAAGTILLLLLIKLKQIKIWKIWFFIAVFLTIAVSLNVYMSIYIAYAIAIIIALIKIFKPSLIVQNLSEVLMYSGIAVLFVPMLTNVIWAVILLILISLYDAYAVWKSKHMISLANFQTESKVFAGLFVPYKKQKGKSAINFNIKPAKNHKSQKSGEDRIAILGGGDIAFPLIFSGSVMQWLITDIGLNKFSAFLQTQIITVFVTVALFLLLSLGKKNKFYPAMPFLAAGCFLGFGIVYLFQFII